MAPSYLDSASDSFSFGESTSRLLVISLSSNEEIDISDASYVGFFNFSLDELTLEDTVQPSLNITLTSLDQFEINDGSIAIGGWSRIATSPSVWTTVSTK